MSLEVLDAIARERVRCFLLVMLAVSEVSLTDNREVSGSSEESGERKRYYMGLFNLFLNK